MSERPKGPQRWDIQELGEEWAVYDEVTGSVHILNKLAGKIWQESRQGRKLDEIVGDLKNQYPEVPGEQLARDIRETLEGLRSIQLLA